MRDYNLTELEKKACKAIADALEASTFGTNDFEKDDVAGADEDGSYETDLCIKSDIAWDDRKQLGALITSLNKKHVIMTTKGETWDGRACTEIWGLHDAVRALAD